MDWYVYQGQQFARAFRTQHEARAWALGEIAKWRAIGAPRIPQYRIHFNRSGSPAEIVTEEA